MATMSTKKGRVYLGIGPGSSGAYHDQAAAAIQSLGFELLRWPQLRRNASAPTADEIAEHFETQAPDAIVLPLCFKHADTPAEDIDAAATLFRNEVAATKQLTGATVDTDSSMHDRSSLASRAVQLPPQFGSLYGAATVSPAAEIEPRSASSTVEEIQSKYAQGANQWAFADESELLINIQSLLIRTLPHLAVAHVMFSSSLRGMEQEHAEFQAAMAKLGHRLGTTYSLLNFADRPPTAKDDLSVSLELVRRCTVYIGAARTRYGSTIPGGLSLTHSEYQEARRLLRPRAFLRCTTAQPPDVHAPQGTDADRAGLAALDSELSTDPAARVVEYDAPREIRSRIIPLIDFLLRPGTDMAAAPVPDKGSIYEAHPYPLLDDHRSIVRRTFIDRLERWRVDPRAPALLCVQALGGMGKSAVTWAWFRELQQPGKKFRPRMMWWSFYAPYSGPAFFVDRAIEFLGRLGSSAAPSLPGGSLAQRLDQLLSLLEALDGTTLFVLDGVERILRFYKEDKKRVETEGQTIEEVLDRAARRDAEDNGEPYETARRRALMFFTDDAREAIDQRKSDADAAAFARFLVAAARLERRSARIVMTSRFAPTIVADLGPDAETFELAGLDRDEIIQLWTGLGLEWEFAGVPPADPGATDRPIAADLGGGTLTDILVTTLQGYALPIALLGQLILLDRGSGATFSHWKASLPGVNRALDFRAIRSTAVTQAEHQFAFASDDASRALASMRLAAARAEALVARIMWMALRALPRDAPYQSVLRRILDEPNGIHLSSLYIALVDPRGSREFSSEAQLDELLSELRARKLVGYSESTYLYDIHPLLRRACWQYHPDADEHVEDEVKRAGARLSEATRPLLPGRVPFGVIRPAVDDVREFIRVGAPLHALRLFEHVDFILRFRCEGNIVSRREEIVAELDTELRNAIKLTADLLKRQGNVAIDTHGSTTRSVKDLLDDYCRAAERVKAYRADNSLLNGDMLSAERVLPSAVLSPDALGLLMQSSIASAKGRYRMARVFALLAIRESAAAEGTPHMSSDLAGSIRTWAGTSLLEIEARAERLESAKGLADQLSKSLRLHADVESAKVELAIVTAAPGDDAPIRKALGSYEESTTTLHLGSCCSAAKRAALESEELLPISDVRQWNAGVEELRIRAREAGFNLLDLELQLAQDRVALRTQGSTSATRASLDALVARARGLGHDTVLAAALLERAAATSSLNDLDESVRVFAGADDDMCWKRMLRRCTALSSRLGRNSSDLKGVVDHTRVVNSAEYKEWRRIHESTAAAAEKAREDAEEQDRTKELRRRAEQRKPVTGIRAGISDTRGWSEQQILEKLDEAKRACDFELAGERARTWWRNFEAENKHRPALALRLAEELRLRDATIAEFYGVYQFSSTDNIQANLHYLEYSRVRDRLAQLTSTPAANPEATDGRRAPVGPELARVSNLIGVDEADASVREWWERYCATHAADPARVLGFAESILARNATISDAYVARHASKLDDEEGILSYMDYDRLRKQEEERRRKARGGS